MRAGGDCRGSSYHRRLRKAWLLRFFGTGRRCRCHWCGKWLTFRTVTVDRLLPGAEGGKYVHWNIVPACLVCNQGRGKKRPRVTVYPRPDYTVREWAAICGLRGVL